MKATVRLFAIARQAAARDCVEVDLPDGATIAELRRRLAGQCPALAPLLPAMCFAIDARYAADAQSVPAGADVACIPPVSGG
ncbi:MAG: MoaD/ThiS family protein [Thermoguttaceae bacterium]|jgi:molybdopterin converting factor small subunit|nr:MoaD/ThiS family protein [Thermoguttaceae bacterium]